MDDDQQDPLFSGFPLLDDRSHPGGLVKRFSWSGIGNDAEFQEQFVSSPEQHYHPSTSSISPRSVIDDDGDKRGLCDFSSFTPNKLDDLLDFRDFLDGSLSVCWPGDTREDRMDGLNPREGGGGGVVIVEEATMKTGDDGQPSQFDVLFGKGRGVQNHPGNKRYRRK
jgi:hypothetical protein